MRQHVSAPRLRRRSSLAARAFSAALAAAGLLLVPVSTGAASAADARPVAMSSSSGWVSAGTDSFVLKTADNRATAVGTVRWYHGKFPRGYLHRGEYASIASVMATRPVGCIWATTQWGYPLGSLSIPPSFSVSGAATRGKWLVSCRGRGAKLPPYINLDGLSYAKALLNSTTLTICVSATKSDAPRYCANHKMHY